MFWLNGRFGIEVVTPWKHRAVGWAWRSGFCVGVGVWSLAIAAAGWNGGAACWGQDQNHAAPPNPPASAPSPLEIVQALETATIDAIQRAEASVVAVARYRNTENPDVTTAIRGQRPRVEPRPRRPGLLVLDDEMAGEPTGPRDFGSGVIIGPNGAILTAYHVVHGAARLEVRARGGLLFEAEIVGADPRSDLAVIAPRNPAVAAEAQLTPLPLGNAEQLRKGSFLLALGNTFDAAREDGRVSAALGILSNVDRKLMTPPDDFAQPQLRHLPTLLQLDSKLNLGMSGGAVVNLKGELVGITTAAGNPASFDPQAGYAIPLDGLGLRAVEALREGREVEYGFLGIRLDQETRTTRIEGVTDGTPAALGGLLTNDLILEVGGRAVSNADQLVLAINRMPVGEEVPLKIERNGDRLLKTVVLSKLRIQADWPVIVTTKPPSWRGARFDFTSAVFAPNDLNVLSEMSRGTVSVSEVEPGSPAFQAGLRAGQVIIAIDGQPVTTPKQALQRLNERNGPVTLDTHRGQVTIPAP